MAMLHAVAIVVGAALVSGSAPAAPPSLCLPSTWSAGYTRTSDTAASVGNVTHDYGSLFFAIKERGLGVGPNHTFMGYQVQFIQNVTHTTTGITWEDGTTNCYRSTKIDANANKNCYTHPSTRVYHNINGGLGRAAHNLEFKNNSAVVVDVILTSINAPYLPIQTFSWNGNPQLPRKPTFILAHDPTTKFDEKLAKIPSVCEGVVGEEGPTADAASLFFSQRIGLRGGKGMWTHPKAQPKAHSPSATPMPLREESVSKMGMTCAPDTYTSVIYYMDDRVTVDGSISHNFPKREFGIVQNITGGSINGTLYYRFVQKGDTAWYFQESANGTVTHCSTGKAQLQFDRQCVRGYKRSITVNGKPATETQIHTPTSNGHGSYTSIYSGFDGLPLGLMNFTTTANATAGGNPRFVTYFDATKTAENRMFRVPSICAADEAAQAVVRAESEKWSTHLLTASL